MSIHFLVVYAPIISENGISGRLSILHVREPSSFKCNTTNQEPWHVDNNKFLELSVELFRVVANIYNKWVLQ